MSQADAKSEEVDMRVDPQRASQLATNLASVLSTIKSAASSSSSPVKPVRLVAVSKLKPASDILALHAHIPPSSSSPPPQLYFGENYVQELQQKASLLPLSVRWSFIGGLQSNKASSLGSIPNLWAVNSIDSKKKADGLEKGRRAWAESEEGQRLLVSAAEEGDSGPSVRKEVGVFVQVNTSGEESKSGVQPGDEVVELCRYVREQLEHVRLLGLMTIGAIARSQASARGEEGENEDFVCLKEERGKVEEALGLEEGSLELSMGMSADYEEAIRMGSAEVRVGSTIFGERPPKSEAKV